jgi:Mg2+ and Co2+ transporter CorA
VTVQQNDDVRRITAWTTIAAGPTVVSAIYCMNSDRMHTSAVRPDIRGR